MKAIEIEPTMYQKWISNSIGENYSTIKYYMESMKNHEL
ncbi:hypothetical protein CLOBOL_05232 [Enterocloster bolteae ATCC BAA-613]|uniref:Uncharacterized protein n=1 Tax=Enterocloster bolteae (strain ATCC BAA-613 / DSM 15670 / CCUG 46953 / JCM 12243 / WAL 16351) TaxID=411902 RepID=A8RYU7_ENTBW|nr:hypothetical protein CLOBOL_05232 [Enterocloster bolteae ATCC BAA-613]